MPHPHRAPRFAALVIASVLGTIARFDELATASFCQPSGQQSGVVSTVSLRGGAPALRGQIILMDGAGITVATAGEASARSLIAWPAVAGVSGPGSDDFTRYHEPLATALWRVEARAARGDTASAELLLEQLAAEGKLNSLTGLSRSRLLQTQTALRLSRGFLTGALTSYLQSLAVRNPDGSPVFQPGVPRSESASSSLRIIDPQTGLCPSLPPMICVELSGSAIAALAQSPIWLEATTAPEPFGKIVRWYQLEVVASEAALAARGAGLVQAASANSPAAPLPALDAASQSDTTGEALVRAIVLGRLGNAEQRRSARDWLSRRIVSERKQSSFTTSSPAAAESSPASGSKPPDEGPLVRSWQEAWCRLGLGRSFLVEPDAALRRRGVLELLHLPAEFSSTLPILSAIALAEAASELMASGDSASAAILQADLARIMPSQTEPAALASALTAASAASAAPISGTPPPTTDPVPAPATEPPK